VADRHGVLVAPAPSGPRLLKKRRQGAPWRGGGKGREAGKRSPADHPSGKNSNLKRPAPQPEAQGASAALACCALRLAAPVVVAGWKSKPIAAKGLPEFPALHRHGESQRPLQAQAPSTPGRSAGATRPRTPLAFRPSASRPTRLRRPSSTTPLGGRLSIQRNGLRCPRRAIAGKGKVCLPAAPSLAEVDGGLEGESVLVNQPQVGLAPAQQASDRSGARRCDLAQPPTRKHRQPG